MSDDLRAWLNELRSRGIGSETAAQLIAKCEELAGAFGDVPGLLREIADNARNGNAGEMERLVCTAAYLEDTADFLDAALRAPGGGS